MYIYLNKNIPGRFFRPDDPLNESNCDIIGSTAEDYADGKFVEISEGQMDFAVTNPEAGIAEILAMKIDVAELLGREKARLLADLDCHDRSREVNSFCINGEELWFTPLERATYTRSVESAKLLGVKRLQFYAGETLLEVSTEEAERMLAMIQLYADNCFMVTKGHKIRIERIASVEELMQYDYTAGYPDKLNFEILKPCFTEEE